MFAVMLSYLYKIRFLENGSVIVWMALIGSWGQIRQLILQEADLADIRLYPGFHQRNPLKDFRRHYQTAFLWACIRIFCKRVSDRY